MAREPRVAAHLGRPETPEETTARKAENSKRYRQSQSLKNLLIALGVTLAVVAVVYFGVPRGELESAPEPDVAAVAEAASRQFERTIVVPDAPDDWGVNLAEVEAGAPAVWTINFNDIPGADRSFVRYAQALDADDAWAVQQLGGAGATGTRTIAGVEWTEYEIPEAAATRNITYALGVQAGVDHLLVYGQTEPDMAIELAEALAGDVELLREENAE